VVALVKTQLSAFNFVQMDLVSEAQLFFRMETTFDDQFSLYEKPFLFTHRIPKLKFFKSLKVFGAWVTLTLKLGSQTHFLASTEVKPLV
jgi:hypothetical protein